MIRVFEVHGNEYEMGYQVGEVFKDYLQGLIPRFEKMLGDAEMRAAVEGVTAKLRLQYPNLLMEMEGRADGAGIPRDAAMLMFFIELYTHQNGCTTAILKKENGHVLFCHNDDEFSYHTDNVALIKYNYGDFWIISYTVAYALAGSAFSWNSAGMVFSSNFIFGSQVDFYSISRFVMERDIINARSMDEAMEKLRSCQVASAFSLNILDSNTDAVVNVEKDLTDLYVTPISDRYARSNHFIAKTKDLLEPPAETVFRYQKAKELLAGVDAATATITELMDILHYQSEDYETSIFKDTDFYDRHNRCNKKSFENMGLSFGGDIDTVRFYDASENCVSEVGLMDFFKSMFRGMTVANFSFDSETKHIRVTDYLGHAAMEMAYGEFKENDTIN